jgi:hypothetical protein
MSLKYIVNSKGKTTEVVVPIQQWEKMTKKKNRSGFFKNKLSAYVGKIKLTADPLKYQKAIRNEW